MGPAATNRWKGKGLDLVKSLQRAIIVVLILLSGALPASAMPAAPIPIELTQPDGSIFYARLTGDESLNWYQSYGRAIMKNSSGWWTYAERSSGSGIKPGKHKVSSLNPGLLGIQQGLQPKGSSTLGVPSSIPGGGPPALPHTQKLLMILVDFNDQSAIEAPEDFRSDYLGSIGRSVADYYEKVSNGKFTIVGAEETSGTADDGVIGWVRLADTHPNCIMLNGSCKGLAGDAVTSADSYVDFSSYDPNSDGAISSDELSIMIVVAGYDAAVGVGSPAIWPHMSTLPAGLTLDGKTIEEYVMIAEQQATQPVLGEGDGFHRSTIGVGAHELGHLMLRWPDLYDGDNSSMGAYIYDIMAAGAFGKSVADSYTGQTPVYPSSWTMQYAGFITPDVVSSGATVSADALSGTAPKVLRIPTGNTHEYFLVENRHPLLTSYDSGLDLLLELVELRTGALVWHVDESFLQTGKGCVFWNNCNNSEGHKLIDVEEADGVQNFDSYSLYKPSVITGLKDFYRGGGATSFNDFTNPAARFYSTRNNGVSLSGFTAPGESMALDVAAYDGAEETPVNILGDPGFENGGDWTETSALGYALTGPEAGAHGGSKVALLGDANNATDTIEQSVTVTPGAADAYLQFHYTVFTAETTTKDVYDTVTVEIRRSSDNVLLRTTTPLTNLSVTGKSWNVSAQMKLSDFVGQTIKLRFVGKTDEALPTAFYLDDISLFTIMPGADVVAPTTTMLSLPPLPNGSNGWYRSNPLIYMSRNESGNTYWAWDTGNWNPYSGSFFASNGIHTLYYYSRDISSNEESEKSRSFKVDAIRPTGSVRINGGAVYSRFTGTNLNLAATDTGGSGLAKMRFSNNNSTWTPFYAFASTKAHQLQFTQGLRTVFVQFTDNAGNLSSTYEDQIFLDSVRPNGYINIPRSARRVSGRAVIKTTWAGSDYSPGSGVANYTVQWRRSGSSTWYKAYGPTVKKIAYFGISTKGTYYFRILIKDKAGNYRYSAQKAVTVY